MEEAPHVVILPFPAQGHINPMLDLSYILAGAGFSVSFVTTDHTLRRIDTAAIHSHRPTIQFHSIPDGLPPEHPRSGLSSVDLFFSTPIFSKPAFKDLVASLSQPAPVTCVVSDGIMSFAIDVAEELGIPAITFRTYNATCTWIYFHLQKLIEEGEIPVNEGNEEDLERQVTSIPGLETVMMRRRDLPHICRLEADNKILQFYIDQTAKMTRASALILNTFEELETPIISQLRSIFPTVYTVGPLHSSVIDSPPRNSSSMMQRDESCMEWLQSHPPKSVLYVSFGSIVILSRAQVLEIWWGLLNSGKRFLWAIRPDSVWDEKNGVCKIPQELKMGFKEMSFLVSWAPQDKVLAHQAVGGFLTHSGWNSTLESIWAGKPMLCWPRIADQQVNSMCVGEMWKIGIDMKDICDRSMVEKTVRDLMEGGGEEFAKSTLEIMKLAQDSVRDGGSSNRNIKKFIRDIRSLHETNHATEGNI